MKLASELHKRSTGKSFWMSRRQGFARGHQLACKGFSSLRRRWQYCPRREHLDVIKTDEPYHRFGT